MSRALFDSLGEVHRFQQLEPLLDHVSSVIADYAGFSIALVTFYFERGVFYGAAGCPDDVKERFRQSFERTTEERRREKRAEMLQYRRPGTNICFIPAGEGPRPSSAYLPGKASRGSWAASDRLIIFLRDWKDDIIGVLSLDNPLSGNRPTEETYQVLEDVDGYVNVVAKIAENRFWSLRLQESEASYRAVFDAATDGLFVLTPTGEIVATNRAARLMHGYDEDELMGRSVRMLVHPEDLDQLEQFLDTTSKGSDFQGEARDLRRDGSDFDVAVRGASFQYRGRKHLLAVVQDVSEQKRILQRLLAQQKEESIVAVAGGVAHDFNNVLMGITGSVSLLRQDVLPTSEAARQCERIEASAAKLSRLTGQLRAIARGVHSEPRPTSLAQVIEENLPLVRGMVGSRFALEVEVGPDLWSVHADRVQLGQILLNLSQNACEAMQRGGTLRIRADNVEHRDPWRCERTGTHPTGAYVRLRVDDDGDGMDEATKERIFDPYYSTKPTGSGLGLAAVLGIVRRHAGAISLESHLDGGTAVAVLLPRSTEEHEELAAPAVSRPRAPAKTHILLVDDEDIVREVTEEMLKALGYAVTTADSGSRALAIYERDGSSIDLVLLDVTMPDMTGVETTEALLKLDRDARIILSSGHTEHLVREDVGPGRSLAGFIQKPYTMRALDDAITGAFGGERETSARV